MKIKIFSGKNPDEITEKENDFIGDKKGRDIKLLQSESYSGISWHFTITVIYEEKIPGEVKAVQSF
jgi:hypothetical protein